MNYIVSPVWVYIFGIVDSLNAFAITITVLSAVCACVCAFLTLIAGDITKGEECAAKLRGSATKVLKKSVVICVVFSLVAVMIPNQETLMYMQIAKHSTPETVEQVVDSAKNAVDYIVESVKSLEID